MLNNYPALTTVTNANIWTMLWQYTASPVKIHNGPPFPNIAYERILWGWCTGCVAWATAANVTAAWLAVYQVAVQDASVYHPLMLPCLHG